MTLQTTHILYSGKAPTTVTLEDVVVGITKSNTSCTMTIMMIRKNHVVVSYLDLEGSRKKYEVPATWSSDKILLNSEDDFIAFQLWKANTASALVDSKVERPKRVRPAAGESKMDKCKAIFSANKDKSREEIVKMFVDIALCTPQGAVTYYLTCKKTG